VVLSGFSRCCRCILDCLGGALGVFQVLSVYFGLSVWFIICSKKGDSCIGYYDVFIFCGEIDKTEVSYLRG
jgi:hypothetical protein